MNGSAGLTFKTHWFGIEASPLSVVLTTTGLQNRDQLCGVAAGLFRAAEDLVSVMTVQSLYANRSGEWGFAIFLWKRGIREPAVLELTESSAPASLQLLGDREFAIPIAGIMAALQGVDN